MLESLRWFVSAVGEHHFCRAPDVLACRIACTVWQIQQVHAPTAFIFLQLVLLQQVAFILVQPVLLEQVAFISLHT